MSTRFVVVTFTVLGLATAGFASTTPTSTEVGPAPANLTVLLKNRDFPLKVRMTVEPCAVEACFEI